MTDTQYRLNEAVPIGMLAILGIVLGVSALEFLLRHPDPPVLWRMEVFVVVALTAVILYGGYRLSRGGYGSADLWMILGWTLVGVVGAGAIGAGIYAHQQTEQATIAEPTFVFELLSLIGATTGLAFGLTRRHLVGGRSRSGTEPPEAIESERFWEAVSLLGDDTTTLQQRFTLVEHLADTSTQELPVEALAARLAGEQFPSFPDDKREVSTLLFEKQLPALRDTELVEVDTELDTVRYVGPESIPEWIEA